MTNNKIITAAGLLTLGWLLFFPGPAPAQSSGCISQFSGWVCAPPNGGMETDINGKIVCGPGQCARDSAGKVMCSSVPGGAVTMDSTGKVLCVEGCVAAASSYCAKPK